MNIIFHLIIALGLFIPVSSSTYSLFENDEAILEKTSGLIKLNKTKVYENAVREGASDDPVKQHKVLVLTKIIIQSDAPEDITNFGFLPHLVKYLDSKNVTIQFQAAISLAYLAFNSSETAKKIAEYDAIPKFYKLLHSTKNPLFLKLSIGFLSTIVPFQSHYNEMELVKEIQKCLYSNPSNAELMEESFLVFAKLCSCETFFPQKETVQQILPILFELLQHQNKNIRDGVGAAFGILAIAPEKQYQNIFDKRSVIKAFIELLDDKNENVRSSALTVLVNIIHEGNQKFMISYGILKNIPGFLSSSNKNLVRSAVITVQKVSELNSDAIFQYPAIIPSIIKHLSSFDDNIKVNAILFLVNIISKGTESNILLLLKNNVIAKLCEILKANENENVGISEAILIGYHHMLLKFGHRKCYIFDQLEKCGGIKKLNELANHQNDKWKVKASKILDLYYQEN